MASTVTILGIGSGAIFGCPDTTSLAGQSFDKTREADKVEMKDGNGGVVAAAYNNFRKSYSFAGKVKGEVPSVDPGTVITVDSATMILESLKIGKKSGDFTDVTIEAIDYDEITLSSGTAI